MDINCTNPITIDKIQEGMTGQQVSDLLYSNFDKLNKGKADKKAEQDIKNIKEDQIGIYNRTAKNRFISEVYYVMSKIKLSDTIDFVINNAPSVQVNSVKVVKGAEPSVVDSDDSRNVKLDFVLPTKTTVNVGSTTTLEPGQQASVTNTGDEYDAVFEFSIPRGDKGEKGDQGLKGDSGVQLGDVSLVQDFSVEEGSEDKVISQKAITQKFNEVDAKDVVLTEEEYEALPTKDEDKFYYTYEEE